MGLPRGLQERAVRRGGRQLARRLEGWSRFGAIDMTRTVAFSEELNYAPSIWLNVRDRDPLGTVAPGRAYDELVENLRARLLAWRHPLTDANLVRAVHRREELYDGPCVPGAPDLVLELALENGYSYVCLPSTGAESESVRALAAAEYVAGKGGGMNGSHRATGLWSLAGPAVTPGIRADAAIIDVAPTVLHLAGLRVPSWMDGRLLPGVRGEAAVDAAPPTLPEGAGTSDGDAGEAELWRRLAALGYLGGERP
jgi:predicted AlkP superfamily phosphohydrolase/phosphomutase